MSGTDIERVRSEFLDELSRATSEQALKSVRDRYVGRKGSAIAALMKSVADAPVDQRRELGRLANELKTELDAFLAERRVTLEAARPVAGAVDVTLPGRPIVMGRQHPLTQLREQIEGIFVRMGYEVLEGPELEDEYHNFEALNIPPEHPARDMQDTLYLSAPVRGASLLRTHTSGMQIRHMETHRPPVRIIAPGRVYRRDDLDFTHSPMFQQIEGLVVGEAITMADLKGTLIAFLRELFAPEIRVLFRPTFFPYTEPSADVFITCVHCEGRGCPVCKKTGWLEVLGSGMVHPAVFEAVGYDPERYTGFAFGVGLERIAILKYRVEDIRLFYENDLRFLEQFPL